MKPLRLGEYGDVMFVPASGRQIAMVYYRDFAGRKRRVKRSGRSKAEARRRVIEAVERVIRLGSSAQFDARSTLGDVASEWLTLFQARVEQGVRSPATLDLYWQTVERHIKPGIGGLRLGELTTSRLDRFLQAVLVLRGHATAKRCRSVLSGICGWLVRQDALSFNPVRDAAPLELNRDRTARAMSPDEVHGWLALLESSPFAVRRDLPELSRFMLATGVRLGEALGVRWSDVDMARGVVSIERTVFRVRGKGLVASKPKSRTSLRVLVLPPWCLSLLRTRRVRLGAFDGPLFPDARGGYRDRNNVSAAFRQVREGTAFDWVRPHTFRKTVATILDSSGASARLIADQLGHARISMTQDVYMGRRAVGSEAAAALEAHNPDGERPSDEDA